MTASVVVSITGRQRSLHGRSVGFNYDPSLCRTMMQQAETYSPPFCEILQYNGIFAQRSASHVCQLGGAPPF